MRKNIRAVVDFFLWPTPVFGLGAFIIFSLGLLFGRNIPGRWVDFLRDWQTLVGSVIACLAAFVTVVYIRRQIIESKNQFELSSNLERNSERIMMPNYLIDISKYISLCMNVLAARFYGKPELVTFDIEFLPYESLRKISMIGAMYANLRPDVFESIKDIIYRMQYMTARMGDHSVMSRSYICENYCQFIYCKAIINSMFDFARFRSESINKDAYNEDSQGPSYVGSGGIDKMHHRIMRYIRFDRDKKMMRPNYDELGTLQD